MIALICSANLSIFPEIVSIFNDYCLINSVFLVSCEQKECDFVHETAVFAFW